MQTGGYTYQSEFAKRYLAQGKAEGKAEGRIEGEAQALLRILVARGLSVSPAERAQILGCTELVVLEGWLDHALTASSVAEVLAAAM